MLLGTMLADAVTGGGSIRVTTLEAISQNQLLVFLFANLLTGGINMLVPTIFMSHAIALSILVLYSTLVMAFAWYLRRRCKDDTIHRII
jgi:phosphatidylinositol glycan class W